MNVVESESPLVVVPLAMTAIVTATNWLWFGTTDYGDAAFGLEFGLAFLVMTDLRRSPRRRAVAS